MRFASVADIFFDIKNGLRKIDRPYEIRITALLFVIDVCCSLVTI